MQRSSEQQHWEDFWSRGRSIKEVYPHSDSLVRNLMRIVDVRGKKVLEVGAGSGRDSLHISKAGGVVTVLDYAQSALDTIQSLFDEAQQPVSIVKGDAVQSEFPDATFDVVFHQGLLEHFRDPIPLLQENVRILAPGGYLLVDVPQRYHLYSAAKHILIWMDKWFAGWETEFSMGELKGLFLQQELAIVHTYGDWMHPSFFYRVLREAGYKAGLKLPLYPPTIPGIRDLRRTLKSALLRCPLSDYTYITIGVIGQKQEPTA